MQPLSTQYTPGTLQGYELLGNAIQFIHTLNGGAHIVLIQETHLISVEVTRLQRRWRRQIFATTYSAFAQAL